LPGTTARARPQAIGAELVEATEADAQLGCYLPPSAERTARLAVYLAGVGDQVASSQNPIVRTGNATVSAAHATPMKILTTSSLFQF